MRVAARKSSDAVTRRERLLKDRLRAHALRQQFPQIAQLRINLQFGELEARTTTPSPQTHTLFAPAPAFFRFPCPCADCDGEFDLTAAATELLAKASTRGRSTSMSAQVACEGVRFRDHATLQSGCPMQLKFELTAEPLRPA